MTPLERLLLEAIPTRPQPAPGREPPLESRPSVWTPAEQDAHWQGLCAAVGTPGIPRPARLRLVTDTAA